MLCYLHLISVHRPHSTCVCFLPISTTFTFSKKITNSWFHCASLYHWNYISARSVHLVATSLLMMSDFLVRLPLSPSITHLLYHSGLKLTFPQTLSTSLPAHFYVLVFRSTSKSRPTVNPLINAPGVYWNMNFSTPGVCCMLGLPCAQSVLCSLIGLTSLWTHAQRCVHVIFCRCFFYIFLWPP